MNAPHRLTIASVPVRSLAVLPWAVVALASLSSCRLPAPPTVAACSALAQESAALDAMTSRLRPIFEAYRSFDPVSLADGRIVFASDREGITQLYVADGHDARAPARRLASPPQQPALRPTVLSGARGVVYLSDVGGDEQFHLLRADLGGVGFIDLTPQGGLHRDRAVAATGTDDTIAYSARTTGDPRARVFVRAASGPEPPPIFIDKHPGEVVAITQDGARVLYKRFLSENSQELFVIRAIDGQAQRLYPPPGELLRIDSAALSRDGQTVFAAVTALHVRCGVVALDGQTGALLARYREADLQGGFVSALSLSPAEDRLALSIDGGDHTELRVLDPHGLALRSKLDIGLATARLGPFAPDGRLLLSLSRAEAPTDLFAISADGALQALRAEPRPSLATLPLLSTRIEQVRSFDGLLVPVNVYRPAASEPSFRHRTVVLIHGGPSWSSHVEWSPSVRALSSLGYAVVQPNIRGSTGFGVAYEQADDRERRGDALGDIGAVRDWAARQPWCDSRHLVIMGTSYGGYMTLQALARQPTAWAAGIDISGMSNLITMERLEDQAVRVYDETEFGALGKDDALLWEWSPLKYVDRIVAPLFVYQGKNDPITPRNEAEQIVAALRLRAVPVEYMLLDGEGHGTFQRKNTLALHARIARFLERSLAGSKGGT